MTRRASGERRSLHFLRPHILSSRARVRLDWSKFEPIEKLNSQSLRCPASHNPGWLGPSQKLKMFCFRVACCSWRSNLAAEQQAKSGEDLKANHMTRQHLLATGRPKDFKRQRKRAPEFPTYF